MTEKRILRSIPDSARPNRYWVSLTDTRAVNIQNDVVPLTEGCNVVATYPVLEREIVHQAGRQMIRLVCLAPGTKSVIKELTFAHDDEAYSVSDDGNEVSLVHLTTQSDLLSASFRFPVAAGHDEAAEIAWEAAGLGRNVIETFEPIPEDANGQLAVSPISLSVAKRN